MFKFVFGLTIMTALEIVVMASIGLLTMYINYGLWPKSMSTFVELCIIAVLGGALFGFVKAYVLNKLV